MAAEDGQKVMRRAGWRLVAACGLLALAGCGGGRHAYDGSDPNAAARGLDIQPGRYYRPPGPANDPWGPYVRQAAGRFALPERWIRAVMRQESGGQQQAVSPVGAMGLMQLMPATYGGLRGQYGLGADPFEPHDNLMAGAGYLRQMYDRFGSPGFLAAYNAGPERLDRYLNTGTPLPAETVGYLTAIAPQLGTEVAMSGPLAVYAGGAGSAVPGEEGPGEEGSGQEVRGEEVRVAQAPTPTPRSLAAGCDPDAAYDPDRPCQALERAAVTPTPVMVATAGAAAARAGFEQAGGGSVLGVAERAQARRMAAAGEVPRAADGTGRASLRAASGAWAIQVGAFASPELARAMAARAQAQVPDLLGEAVVSVPETSPFGGRVLFRARLADLSAVTAPLACQRLNARQLPCIVVRPLG